MRRTARFVLAAVSAAALAACSGTTPETATGTPPTSTVVSAAAAPTSAPPPAKVQVHAGEGNDVVTLDQPVDIGILAFDCSTCAGTVQVKTDAAYDPDVIFYGTEAPYDGKVWLGMRGDKVTRIQVTAKGPWTVTVGGIDQARHVDGTTPITGEGDDVVVLAKPADAALITNKGGQYSNFMVDVMTDATTVGPDLAVNERGASYQGTVLFPATGPKNIQLVQVKSDGSWSITPK